MAQPVDPRPLVGEPLALDLLNTEWMSDGAPVDFLATPDGPSVWLRSAGIGGEAGVKTKEALIEARAAIRDVVSGNEGREHWERLNAVLAHGRLCLGLGEDGYPEQSVEVSDPAWRPAFLAAHNLHELLKATPDRIRRCDHPQCVLWFLDTSRNGTRRWCSMASCGNRAKAQRHYSRTHESS